MKALFIIFSSIAFVACAQIEPASRNLQSVVNEMERRYVFVSTPFGWGSAVDIGNGYALTAGHVAYRYGELVDSMRLLASTGAQSCFVADTVDDVALLRWPGSSKTANFSSKVYLGELVYWLQPLPNTLHGNGSAKFVLNTAFVNSVDSSRITLTLPVLRSGSGTALFNARGQIIGLLTECMNYEVKFGQYAPSYAVAIPFTVFKWMTIRVRHKFTTTN